MEFDIVRDAGYFRITISGAVEAQAFEGLIVTLVSHEDWQPGMPILVDETGFDASEISMGGVRSIAESCIRHQSRLGQSRLAIVVGRDMEYGMNRMWGAFVDDNWRVIPKFFRSHAEAIDWLSA